MTFNIFCKVVNDGLNGLKLTCFSYRHDDYRYIDKHKK